MSSESPARQRSELEGGLDYAAPGAGASIEVVVVVIDPEDGRGDGDVVANLVFVVNLIHESRSLLASTGTGASDVKG